MTIALVGPEIEENLSLRYLASALEAAGIDTELVPFNGSAALGSVLDSLVERHSPYELIALSLAFQWRALDFLAIAVGLRERGFAGHVTAGGHFGTFAAAELLRDFPELDSICRQEAEQTVVDLARAVRSGSPLGEVPGLALRGNDGHAAFTPARAPADLDALRWPDRRGEPSSCLGHPVAAMVGSRGCYAKCDFCCIAAWHELALPGKRYRLRAVEDIADEMAWLHRSHHREIFVFHDDDFFLPKAQQSAARIETLAQALRKKGVGRIATVVKARPNDVDAELFKLMKERLGLIRVFLGIENASAQGLVTLGRGVGRDRVFEAMRTLQELEIYTCFNLLLFDPDTTVDSLEENLQFLERYGDSPSNFGRVELYSGTPLLARMQGEKRAWGDYLGHDYRLGDSTVQRCFEMAMQCFRPRNFAPGALANRLMGTRFDVEVARHFDSDLYRPEWLTEAKALSAELARDSASALREIIGLAKSAGGSAERLTIESINWRLRQTENTVLARAQALEVRIQRAVGRSCRHARPGPDGIPLEASLTATPTPTHGEANT